VLLNDLAEMHDLLHQLRLQVYHVEIVLQYDEHNTFHQNIEPSKMCYE